jgi:hypothetical protein
MCIQQIYLFAYNNNYSGGMTRRLNPEEKFWPKIAPQYISRDHLFGLVHRVPGYWSRGPGSITGITRFSDK